MAKKRRKAIPTLREQRFQINRERLFNCLPKNIRGIYNTVRLNWKLFSWSQIHEKVTWKPPLLDHLTSFGQSESAPGILSLY